MITASDVAKRLDTVDPVIDEFIEEHVFPALLRARARKIDISSELINKFYNDKGSMIHINEILNQFRIRGFDIKHECDDRPCGQCWYVITIPPQQD